jgi:hypothetical protein
MKRFGLALLLALAACGEPRTPHAAPGGSPTPPAPAAPPAQSVLDRAAEAKLVALEQAYGRALVAKDRAFLMGFYAADWRGGNWTGFWTKSRMIGSLMDGRSVVKSMTLSNLSARIIGSVGVVQGVDDEVSQVDGRDTTGRWAFTDIFERRQGRWVAVASHTSEMKRE